MTLRRLRLIGLGLLLAAPDGLGAGPKTPAPLAGRIIVLDPGHAVKDASGRIINPGARSCRNFHERDIVLKIGAMAVPLLESQGAVVYMTRTPGNPWRYAGRKGADNRSRAIQANLWQADAYVRLHCDWNRSRNFQGITVYYFRWGSRPLGKCLHEALLRALPEKRDNGLRRKSFVSATSRMPAVLLELGVLSNDEDAGDLARGDHQLLLAQAITEGLVNYFSNERPRMGDE